MLMLTIFTTVASIQAIDQCGYKGMSCCAIVDSLNRPYCSQGSCVTRDELGNPLNKCCPNKGESCCDTFGNSNCCNPYAPFCVGGICTDIEPCESSSPTSPSFTPFGIRTNSVCTSDRHCCRSTPRCINDRCHSDPCQYKKCASSADCCGGFQFCLSGQCTNLVIGRPYNLKNSKDLRADIINNCPHDNIKQTLIYDLLSEHASIGTFSKFSIQLMNLGAPLWLIELSQKAALDEINHAKVMLNIINNNGSNLCVEIGKFPEHQIDINGDCNAISLDVVSGGCFGETKASIKTMRRSKQYNELYGVAMDEVKHSALAWISAKWMIDNCENIMISEEKWWNNKLQTEGTDVIKQLFNTFWAFDGEYKQLYKVVHDQLYNEVLSVHQKL